MRLAAWFSAALTTVLVAESAPAQYLGPPLGGPLPAPGIVVAVGGHHGGHHHGRRLTISGFLGDRGLLYYGGIGVPAYPYGPVPRVTVQYVTPVYVSPPPPVRLLGAGRPADDDIAGIDLDLIPAKKPPEAAKPPAPPPFEIPGGVDVSVPKKPVRPEDQPEIKVKPEPPKPAPPPLPPPKNNPVEEAARLVNLGLAAFANQEYGLAALRFRQATDVDPESARAHFLAAQASLALGKYKDAVNAIEQGMRRRLDWPKADFNPRKELYKGNAADFVEHLERLQQTHEKTPHNSTYLFLYAYALWFEGRQAEAVPLFRRARTKTADPAYIDAFLKAAPGGVLAVR
jgi:hypothetical protein